MTNPPTSGSPGTDEVAHGSDNSRPAIRLDLASILERLGNDRDLLNDLIDIYLTDIDQLLKDLAISVEKRNSDQAARAAHSIKGLASNFGMTPVSHDATKVERSANASDWADVDGLIDDFSRNARVLQKVLIQVRAGGGQS